MSDEERETLEAQLSELEKERADIEHQMIKDGKLTSENFGRMVEIDGEGYYLAQLLLDGGDTNALED